MNQGPEGLEVVDYDDAARRTVNVPHDWSIEGDYASGHPTRDNAGYVQAGKASVFLDRERILDLEERFAEVEGFYWGSREAAANSISGSVEHGAQAEAAQLSGGARVSTQGSGFHATGYVELPTEGSITWFAENDGSPDDYDLIIRYTGKDKQGGRAFCCVLHLESRHVERSPRESRQRIRSKRRHTESRSHEHLFHPGG